MSGFTMVDRGKFKVFERLEAQHAQISDATKTAEARHEAAGNRLDGDIPMNDLLQRMGRAIQVRVFKATLQRLNPNLIFEISKADPSKYGIYIKDYTLNKSGAVVEGQPRFICGMESGLNLGRKIDDGVMPEFSYLETEDEVVPDGDHIRKIKAFKREIRGWRTVLAALFTEGILTEPQIEREFRISEGKSSANWQQRLGKTL